MSNQFQIPEEEQHELDLLGAELRDAMPEISMSADFHERLAAQMHNNWTLRSAFQNNRLIRVAAGLLVMTLAATPVAAWVGLWPQQKKTPPLIGFELPTEIDVDQSGGTLGESDGNQVIGPNDEFEAFEWSEERSLAVERSNRMASAVASFEANVQADEYHNFHSGDQPRSWVDADAQGLWNEFGRRCQSANLAALPSALVQRCEDFLQAPLTDPVDHTEIAARAAWAWLLHGEQAAAGTVKLAWPAAPFVVQG